MRQLIEKVKRLFKSRDFVVYMSLVLMMVMGVAYTNYVSRKICGLIVTLDDIYQTTPVTTEAGKKIAREVHSYREDLHC